MGSETPGKISFLQRLSTYIVKAEITKCQVPGAGGRFRQSSGDEQQQPISQTSILWIGDGGADPVRKEFFLDRHGIHN